jgi:hypothetical protein
MVQPTKFRQLKNKYQKFNLVTTDYQILSNNKVTGWSVNFPIVRTCKPSKVCSETCYGLTGPITWSTSLNKQTRNYNWVKSDPSGFTLQLEREVRKRLKTDPKFYIRWNGVGDLFKESVESIKRLNELVPELPIWCVTRIPQHVLPLKDLVNVWVHFSLDRDTLKRRDEVEKLTQGDMRNLFYSYQTDRGELVAQVPQGISVLFFDKYRIPEGSNVLNDHPSLCPLNLTNDISNVCYSCRRCFNGDGVRLKSIRSKPRNDEN